MGKQPSKKASSELDNLAKKQATREGRTYAFMPVCMHACMRHSWNDRIDRRMRVWMRGWMDGRMDGSMSDVRMCVRTQVGS